MGVILDMNFLYALFFEDDERHKDAIGLLERTDWKKFGTPITNGLIISELYALGWMRSKGDVRVLGKIKDLVFGVNNFFLIEEVNFSEMEEIVRVMEKYSNPKSNDLLSSADTSLIFLATKYKIKQIISFDHHFDGKLERIFEIE